MDANERARSVGVRSRALQNRAALLAEDFFEEGQRAGVVGLA